ncbi:MAG: Bug family tripartite tricarboxylate transporter substrate binding protein [bacterium]|jgi:tripartite-type tricarboxylate transporter receptor subunit TctC|nr:tripartite tricarboxylate transporter substrate binding protein [Betaproteobacteria bacterium]
MSAERRAVALALAPSVVLAAAAAAIALPDTVHAQAWPVKPVRMVVPFPPAGGTDVIARIIAPRLGEALGQQVVIDNRAGANGNVGTELVARASADGYTVLLNGGGTLAVNPSLYSRLPYDSLRDFAPVSLVALQPSVLVVHPSVPARSVAELIALARRQPGQLNYASSGSGSLAHLSAEVFKTMARVDMVHVPYKGAGPSLADLLAGQVHLIFASSPSVMPHVQNGRLRALGVTTARRVRATPDVPTIAEAGVPGFELTGWYGLLAPAGTPAPVVGRLNAELVKTLGLADVQEKLVGQGLEVATSTPREFADFLKSEIAKYARVVREAGVKVD